MKNEEFVRKFYSGIKGEEKKKLISPNELGTILTAINLAYGDAKRTLTGITATERDSAKIVLAKGFKIFLKTTPLIAKMSLIIYIMYCAKPGVNAFLH